MECVDEEEFMKRAIVGALVLLLFTAIGYAAPTPYTAPPFPKTLINAKYVFVTSYDGDQFDQQLLPEDRQAISSVQDAIQKWGHYVIVYRPEDADIVLMVQSRPSEDLLAVYDGKLWPEQTYLWRVMARGGLDRGETPLVSELQTAVDQASK
jgi:predicted Zn-dependent protease